MRLVAFDLSSTTLGYCVLSGDKKHIKSGIVKFEKYSASNFVENCKTIEKLVKIVLCNCGEGEDIVIGFELTNFKNPMVSNRHNFYMGSIVQEIFKQNTSNNLVFKFFNANAWHCLFGWNNKEREELKQLSCEFFEKQLGFKAETDDEADAFCIAFCLDHIKSTEQTRFEVATKKKQVLRNKKELVKLQNMLIARYKKKQTPKIIREIEEINFKIKELKNE